MFKRLKKKAEPKIILDFLFIIISIVLVISMVFDFSITVFNYYLHGTNFYVMEANKLFVWGLQNGYGPIFNPSVVINLFLFGIGCDVYLKYRKKQTVLWGILSLTFAFAFVVMAIAHFVGGFSWIFLA